MILLNRLRGGEGWARKTPNAVVPGVVIRFDMAWRPRHVVTSSGEGPGAHFQSPNQEFPSLSWRPARMMSS